MQGDGDIVTATVLPDQPGMVRIDAIAGDGGRLSMDASKNCVGIAASETLALLEASFGSPLSCGVALQLQKVSCRCTWKFATADPSKPQSMSSALQHWRYGQCWNSPSVRCIHAAWHSSCRR